MSTPEPEPDWEAKFHKAVSENVRQSDAHKRKTASTLQELQLAKAEISELRKQVKQMTPAHAQRELEKADQERKLKAAHDVSAERFDKIVKLEQQISRGHRGILEDVIADLTYRARRLPAPTPEDRLPK